MEKQSEIMRHLIILFLLISFSATAQYKYAFGARFDGSPGITFKVNKGKKASLEALLNSFGNGAKGTLLAEWHQKAFSTGQWRWYYGVGGHAGAANRYRNRYYYDNYVQVGADGILGLEHTFSEIPLNLSVDWKPELNFINNPGLYVTNVGFSARFALKK
ncbi:hypothetical protein EGI31_11240 [Lacihabitans soyangensis]|uniref:Uncharacterized protein n=2 Tax=Lacihabitans soyangensis TaxID=869394 RepID=A0AAE3H400_9BACT|nr:hypothetical protein [Lacihabitans soyangensis]